MADNGGNLVKEVRAPLIAAKDALGINEVYRQGWLPKVPKPAPIVILDPIDSDITPKTNDHMGTVTSGMFIRVLGLGPDPDHPETDAEVIADAILELLEGLEIPTVTGDVIYGLRPFGPYKSRPALQAYIAGNYYQEVDLRLRQIEARQAAR